MFQQVDSNFCLLLLINMLFYVGCMLIKEKYSWNIFPSKICQVFSVRIGHLDFENILFWSNFEMWRGRNTKWLTNIVIEIEKVILSKRNSDRLQKNKLWILHKSEEPDYSMKLLGFKLLWECGEFNQASRQTWRLKGKEERFVWLKEEFCCSSYSDAEQKTCNGVHSSLMLRRRD